jgi:hypothetical protein
VAGPAKPRQLLLEAVDRAWGVKYASAVQPEVRRLRPKRSF